MFSEKCKYYFSIFFLSAFILIKASGLHAFAHNHHVGDADNCALCQLSSRDAGTAIILFSNDFSLEVFRTFIPTEQVDHYEHLAQKRIKVSNLFNRPPPTDIV